ncbi:hypothetical protein BT69DRAFT_1291629 [Atractiella rhizophila]|nr:hypothetical protein BT69DRAFT_1291629 [Atractiella rhizophila]
MAIVDSARYDSQHPSNCQATLFTIRYDPRFMILGDGINNNSSPSYASFHSIDLKLMATLEDFLGLGKRSRTSVDIAKRNNEDGTALSQSKRRKDEESEHQKIPGYAELKILLAASHTLQPDPKYSMAKLFVACQNLIHQVASLHEDDEEPIHHTFSLWRPGLGDIGGKQGLIALRVLWLKLLQVDDSSIPTYLLNARKDSICAVAHQIHAVLAAEGLVDNVGGDDSNALGEDEEDPIGMEIDDVELAESLEQNKKVNPKGNRSTRTMIFTINTVSVSTLNPLGREVAADDNQMNNQTGTTYVKCKHCRWTNQITKSSNGKLTHLEDHLTGSPCHVKATGPLLKLLKKKYEDKVPISEEEKKKAGNEIPITIGEDKRSESQLDILDQLQGMARFGDQGFDQTKF